MNLLILLLLSVLIGVTFADFELSQVSGLYFYERGPPECEEDIVIHQSGTVIRGDQIRGRNFRCSHGHIRIDKGEVDKGNRFTDWFGNGLASVGVFLTGTVEETIICGQRGGGTAHFEKHEVWNFVDTRADVKVDFKKVLAGSKAPLRHLEEIILKDEVEYLFIGERCVYRQSWYLCFPANGIVELRDGSKKRMDEIRLGDEVLVADGKYSPVYMWSHKQDTAELHTFVRLVTDSGNMVTLTPSHHIEASGVLKPAAKVKIGETVLLGNGNMTRIIESVIVKERGFYNPQTLHGDIVVDGVVTSTYTKAVRPKKAHALLAPFRALYKIVRLGQQISNR